MRSLRVRATGPLTLVEDLGRRGGSGIGVGRSGAADRAALTQGNRALGNPEGTAALEVTFGGLEVEVAGDLLWCCVTGAPGEVSVDGRGVGSHNLVSVRPGEVVAIAPPWAGLRSYLCVRGGIAAEEVLGSRSRDVLSGLGPAPVAEGDVLPVGPSGGEWSAVDSVRIPDLDASEMTLDVVRGPRQDWFGDPDVLVSTDWRVTDRSNRVGLRLGGAALERTREEELPSEGVWRGALQVPPSGEPVLFLADHPVTGGYPVVGVVVDAHVDRAAQARPGQVLRFRWVDAP